MKLYHYSSKPLDELLTRRVQGMLPDEISASIQKAKKMGLPLPYIDHISFFMEPIPKDTISAIFNNNHPFWMAGREIYEHVIDTKTIKDNSYFQIVETPVIDKFTDQFDWSIQDLSVRSKYMVAMHTEMTRLGLSGYGIKRMIKGCEPFIGNIEGYYIKSRMRDDAADTATMYAANVPHLMVYPVGGIIPIESVKKIKLGSLKPVTNNLIYHLSFRDNLPSVLIPRQPDGSGEDASEFVERLPARVSFSPTVQQCFAALYPNISQFFEEDNYPHMDMYVYCPVKWGKALPAKTVLTAVWDAFYTGEVCYVDPVTVVKAGKIRIFNPGKDKSSDIYGHPFNNPFIKEQFIAPRIKFQVKELYQKISII